MGQTCSMAEKDENLNTCKIVVGKPQGKVQFVRPRRRREHYMGNRLRVLTGLI